jgi:hypothetical protein
VVTGVGDVPGVGVLGWEGDDEPPQPASAPARAVTTTRHAALMISNRLLRTFRDVPAYTVWARGGNRAA